MYAVCMFLTRCHEFPFPATRGHFRSELEVVPRGRYYCTPVPALMFCIQDIQLSHL